MKDLVREISHGLNYLFISEAFLNAFSRQVFQMYLYKYNELLFLRLHLYIPKGAK